MLQNYIFIATRNTTKYLQDYILLDNESIIYTWKNEALVHIMRPTTGK